MLRFSFAIIFFMSFSSMTCASDKEKKEDAETVEYNALLDRIFAERMKPLAFEANVKHLIRSKTEAGNGDPVFYVAEVHLTVKFDELPGNIYIKQTVTNDLVNLASDPDGEATQQLIKSKLPSFLLVANDRGQFYITEGEYSQVRKSENLRALLPFPWETLGLVMPVELKNKRVDMTEAMARNKKYFGKQKLTLDKDGIATMDLRNQINRIDTKRGYWPIEYLSESRREIKGKQVVNMDRGTRITLVKVGENWVPKKVELSLNASSESYEFDWKSFDSAIDESNFDIAKIIDQEKVTKAPTGIEALLRAAANDGK